MSNKKISSEIAKAFKVNETFDLDFEKEMLMYRFLSEVEKICDEKEISKKELAAKIGTSASYITQLFRGTKTVNLETLAKFQHALGFKYEISAALNRVKSVDDWQNIFMQYGATTFAKNNSSSVVQLDAITPDYSHKNAVETQEISLVA